MEASFFASASILIAFARERQHFGELGSVF